MEYRCNYTKYRGFHVRKLHRNSYNRRFNSDINAYETYEELKAKIAYDAELFNGFCVEVIWNKAKTAPSEYYHIPFKDVRKGLEGEYVYCEDWTDAKAPRISYQPYNPITRESKQLYYCQFYRPGEGTYPLPDYVGALKYIEVDTEISNYLSFFVSI